LYRVGGSYEGNAHFPQPKLHKPAEGLRLYRPEMVFSPQTLSRRRNENEI